MNDIARMSLSWMLPSDNDDYLSFLVRLAHSMISKFDNGNVKVATAPSKGAYLKLKRLTLFI